MQVVNLQNIESPQIVGNYELSTGNASGVTVSRDGMHVYLASNSAGLKILDVQTPANPSLLGAFAASDKVTDVLLSPGGRYAYLADNRSGVQIVDIQNPAEPLSVSTLDTHAAKGISLSSNESLIYVADGSWAENH